MRRLVVLGLLAVLSAAAGDAGAQPTGGLTDRQLLVRELKNEAWGLRCYFRSIPELSMAMRDDTAQFAEFIVTPKGYERSLLNEFRLTLRPGSDPNARFTVQKPAFGTQRIERAALWVDGKPLATDLQTRQQRRGAGTYYDNIGIALPAEQLPALVAGRTAEVAVYDQATGAEAGRWSYDVSRLRHVDRAMDLSKGRCA